ncbi:hypothetical protein LuPra_02730 [Luteitalea pratensis]|uniref:Uncharacterized protein n=1 Tax=Luteitalea pratensis TaxID=1855912 RepID=A0A143PMT1_LUTPR|nr:hypothetical protein LuPra_02730 [Luteitalea pratensis]
MAKQLRVRWHSARPYQLTGVVEVFATQGVVAARMLAGSIKSSVGVHLGVRISAAMVCKSLCVSCLQLLRSTPAASTIRPELSIGVHGSPWTSGPSVSNASRSALRWPPFPVDLPSSATTWGYFWGYGPIWGYRRPGGIGSRDQHDPSPHPDPAREGPRLLVELARTRTPYKDATAVGGGSGHADHRIRLCEGVHAIGSSARPRLSSRRCWSNGYAPRATSAVFRSRPLPFAKH